MSHWRWRAKCSVMTHSEEFHSKIMETIDGNLSEGSENCGELWKLMDLYQHIQPFPLFHMYPYKRLRIESYHLLCHRDATVFNSKSIKQHAWMSHKCLTEGSNRSWRVSWQHAEVCIWLLQGIHGEALKEVPQTWPPTGLNHQRDFTGLSHTADAYDVY